MDQDVRVLPIVLLHGFCGYRRIKIGPVTIPYYRGVDRALAARGHPIIMPGVSPMGSVARRARQLKETLLRQLQIIGHDGKVLIFAHSMGGLDARYMIAKLGMADRVAALLTISTPHRGTPYADWCVRHLGRRLGGFTVLKWLGVDAEGLLDLTIERCAQFNEETADLPQVPCFSVSGARPWHKVPAFALHSYRIVAAAEGINDGLVSVKSSTWGHHLGVWPVDHWHAINKRPLPLTLHDRTGDVTPYYLQALDQILALYPTPSKSIGPAQ